MTKIQSVRLGNGTWLRFYPDHTAVGAVELLVAMGVMLNRSEAICRNPIISHHTFPVDDQYVIMWKDLKFFLLELISMRFVSVVQAEGLFQELRKHQSIRIQKVQVKQD